MLMKCEPNGLVPSSSHSTQFTTTKLYRRIFDFFALLTSFRIVFINFDMIQDVKRVALTFCIECRNLKSVLDFIVKIVNWNFELRHFLLNLQYGR